MSALRISFFFLLVISTLAGISSCSVQKRHYRNGFYVQRDYKGKSTNTNAGDRGCKCVDSTAQTFEQIADHKSEQADTTQFTSDAKNPGPGEIIKHDTISSVSQDSAGVTDYFPATKPKGERGENYSLILSLIALGLTIVALTGLFFLGIPLLTLAVGLIAIGLAIRSLVEVRRYNRSHRDTETGKVIRMPVAAIVISILVLAFWLFCILVVGYAFIMFALYGF